MVIGLLALTAIPTVTGVANAVSQQQKQAQDAKLSQKCNLLCYCEARSSRASQIHGKPLWLCNDKLYVSEGPPAALNVQDVGHPFEGFYMGFPREPDNPMGLVSMSSKSPPAMGWVYVDRDTREVRYGNRSTSMPHIVGAWGWTEDEVGVTLQGVEAFVVVEEQEGVWAVYWDRKGDGKGLPRGKRVLEISVERRPIEEEGPQQGVQVTREERGEEKSRTQYK